MHVLSDLHLETGAYELPPDLEFDILIAAGDIGPVETAIPWLASCGKPVIYVLGNHERYHRDFLAAVAQARRLAKGTKVRVLERNYVVVEGVRFLGCTLWTDLHQLQPDFVSAVQRHMYDYQRVTCDDWLAKGTNRKRLERLRRRHQLSELETNADGATLLHPGVTYLEHVESRRWLDKQLRKRFDGPTVVVSHHAPSYQSLVHSGLLHSTTIGRTQWRHSEPTPALIAAYATHGLLEKLDVQGVDVWVHGHVHTGMDYLERHVRILCNPRGRNVKPASAKEREMSAIFGYPYSEEAIKRQEEAYAQNPFQGDATGFDPALVIDLEDGLARPIQSACKIPLARLRALAQEVSALLPYAGRGKSIPHACVHESFEARLTEQRELLAGIHAKVLSQLDRTFEHAWGSRVTPPPRAYLRALKGQESPNKPADYRHAAKSIEGTALWLETLPTGVTDNLRDLRAALAKAIDFAHGRGVHLLWKRLDSSALRSVDRHELTLLWPKETWPVDAEGKPDGAAREALSVALDLALNGDKPRRQWFINLKGESYGGDFLDPIQLYDEGHRPASPRSRASQARRGR